MVVDNYELLYLENNPYYSYSISLARVSYNITMRYSSREKCWYMDIYTKDNIPVILSTKLVSNYPMLEDFSLNGLTGYFILFPTIDSNLYKLQQEPENIADYFNLVYVYKT